MANIRKPDVVVVEFTYAELEVVRTGLRLIRDFGRVEDWDPATEILSDLSGHEAAAE
ncbi:hypothetical protein [Streptomyces sp. NPDC005907]|uniref:hypothetical protein n=1 Tax=Streptomyces sp. NPDC005907 TaxID=3154571 RepID=UPI0033C057AE